MKGTIAVFGASSGTMDPVYYEAAFEMGARIARAGYNMLFGGGDTGVMGAAARGFHKAGGPIKGVAPTFFNVDGVLFEHCTEFVPTETMRERKQIMEDSADAFIIGPGGIGTFEEFFEILTLKQLERHNKPIVIYNVGGYYDEMIAMLEKTAAERFMTNKSMELFAVRTDAQGVLDYIENYDAKPMDISELKDIR